jgi:hypothetical protein
MRFTAQSRKTMNVTGTSRRIVKQKKTPPTRATSAGRFAASNTAIEANRGHRLFTQEVTGMNIHAFTPRADRAQEHKDDHPAESYERLWDACFDTWDDFDPKAIEPYDFFYGREYLAGSVSALIGDTELGKSRLILTEAVAMATGRNLLGIQPATYPDYPGFRQRVLYWNGEEPLAELKRRVAAICQHHGIGHNELSRLTIVSGHDAPIKIARAERDGVVFDHGLVDAFEVSDYNVIIIDPFISCHDVRENDNTAIDAVVKCFARIATTYVSVMLVHHVRKPAQGNTGESGLADTRGATAFVNAVRMARVLNRMTESEAARAGIAEDDRWRYFRADNGKANYAPPDGGASWYQHRGVLLPNGDNVGVVLPWRFPGAFDGVTPAHMERVRDMARDGNYRSDPRSPEWIGNAVAEVLDIDPEADKGRIKELLKTWFANGALRKVERRGPDRHTFMFVEPGQWKDEP